MQSSVWCLCFSFVIFGRWNFIEESDAILQLSDAGGATSVQRQLLEAAYESEKLKLIDKFAQEKAFLVDKAIRDQRQAVTDKERDLTDR